MARRPRTAPPVPVTPTLGRDSEIAEVRRLLAEGCRILTLVGPGGVGKSRLALEACLHPMRGFPGGVAFVPLETVDEPSDAIRVLADRVGATVEGNQAPLDVAIDRLRGQRMLLLIDNFEQVLEAGPELATLLDACPGVSVLVTTRRPLRLRGERQMTVEPLGLPAVATEFGTVRGAVEAAVRSPAVGLFVERAQRVHPGFVVGPRNAEAIAGLVRRLDGLPLAIELVAARAHVLEPGQMLERLERGTGVPMSAGQDFPQRQRTLRATLEWSHDLLTPSQQTLLARLGMFVVEVREPYSLFTTPPREGSDGLHGGQAEMTVPLLVTGHRIRPGAVPSGPDTSTWRLRSPICSTWEGLRLGVTAD